MYSLTEKRGLPKGKEEKEFLYKKTYFVWECAVVKGTVYPRIPTCIIVISFIEEIWFFSVAFFWLLVVYLSTQLSGSTTPVNAFFVG